MSAETANRLVPTFEPGYELRYELYRVGLEPVFTPETDE